MKHRWLRAALSALLCAVVLAGCAGASASRAETAAADPLTGQEAVWPGQRPAAVTIENATGNTTQWGISTASVVLEALTGSSDTSLCLVYPSVSAMPRVGPVTAGQDLYWRLLVAQQVLPIQLGGGKFDRNYLDYYSIRAVDALEAGRNAFSCADTWSNLPLWYTDGSAVSAVLESLGISPLLSDPAAEQPDAASESESEPETPTVPPLLPQSESAKQVPADAEDAASVQVRFDERNGTGFTYDAESGTYRMLRANGTPQTDANNDTQAAFDNLLILFSASSLRDDGQTLDYDLTMGGGVWLNGGKLWNITWTQGTDATFAFYDSDGEPLTILPGRSYIALVSSLTGQELAVTDSAGENLL